MYALQATGQISESYLDDVLYLLVGVALSVWNKALQNCTTLNKAVVAATAFLLLVPIFQSIKLMLVLHFLFRQTVKFCLKFVTLGKSFFIIRFGADKFLFI